MIRRLVIGTPCAGAKCDVPWLMSAFPLGGMLSAHGIEWVVDPDPSGWTAAARNRICAKALSVWKADAVLFIDSDIFYKPADVMRLLAHADQDEVPIIGGFYPRKKADWLAGAKFCQDLWSAGPMQGRDDPMALAKGLQTAVMRSTHPHTETGPRVTMPSFGDRCRVNLLPAGFMLVRRDGLERFIAATGGADGPWSYQSDYQENSGNQGLKCYGFFQHPIEDHVLFGEDIFFSTQAVKAGIEVWKLCDLELGHAGMVMF